MQAREAGGEDRGRAKEDERGEMERENAVREGKEERRWREWGEGERE